MQRQVTISGFIYEAHYGGTEPQYVLFSTDKQDSRWYTLIGPVAFTYEIPADFNPTVSRSPPSTPAASSPPA